MGFQFDYFYSMETRQYKYFVIPQVLILDTMFGPLSDRAKLLYCVMLDRSSMSARNRWIDERGRVYIIMTREEIMEKMSCSHTTAHKFMQELIDFGLIEKRRRGQGNPDWIYVMNFDKPMENADAPEEPILQACRKSFPEGKKPLPLEGRKSFSPGAGIPFPPEEKSPAVPGKSVALPMEGRADPSPEGKKPLPPEGKKPLPLEGKKPLPLEGKKPLPLEGKKPLPLEGKKPLPLEGKKPLLPEGKKPCLESDLQTDMTDINKSSSSGGLPDGEDDDDRYVRQYLGYETACQKHSKMIVELLYRELVKRDPAVWDRVTQEAFLALCNNVTSYHGGVANVEAYIARCVDNMLVAAAANIANYSPVAATAASHSPPASKSRNAFNNFPQNKYDFAELEEKLLSR